MFLAQPALAGRYLKYGARNSAELQLWRPALFHLMVAMQCRIQQLVPLAGAYKSLLPSVLGSPPTIHRL